MSSASAKKAMTTIDAKATTMTAYAVKENGALLRRGGGQAGSTHGVDTVAYM
ncbi:MAG: hypothetical protein JSS74_05495 [Actinobacteria bacterium]|nr:hypothetical protein [Actinomycetota bacterium]